MELAGLVQSRGWLMINIIKNEAVHFTLIGVILFSISVYFEKNKGGEQEKSIVITQTEIDNLIQNHKNIFGKDPDIEEVERIKKQYIRRKILVQEARKLDLDKDDIIIERRLAQKMTFLFKNNVIADTSLNDLENYYAENKYTFAKEARYGFKQVFFSSEINEEDALQRARLNLEQLQRNKELQADGDAWYLEPTEVLRTTSQIDALLGNEFSSQLAKAKQNLWQGPFRSAYGFHNVYIENYEDTYTPPFEQVKLKVWQDYQLKKSQENLNAYLKTINNTYQIIYSLNI